MIPPGGDLGRSGSELGEFPVLVFSASHSLFKKGHLLVVGLFQKFMVLGLSY